MYFGNLLTVGRVMRRQLGPLSVALYGSLAPLSFLAVLSLTGFNRERSYTKWHLIKPPSRLSN